MSDIVKQALEALADNSDPMADPEKTQPSLFLELGPDIPALEELGSGYPEWAWNKDSLAIVVSDGDGHGMVLYTAGPHVLRIMDDACSRYLDDLGLGDAPEGISVWKGLIKSQIYPATPDSAEEYDSWLEGTFGPLQPEEWQALQENRCPWDDDEWRDFVGEVSP